MHSRCCWLSETAKKNANNGGSEVYSTDYSKPQGLAMMGSHQRPSLPVTEEWYPRTTTFTLRKTSGSGYPSVPKQSNGQFLTSFPQLESGRRWSNLLLLVNLLQKEHWAVLGVEGLAPVARLYAGVEGTSCQAECNFSALSLPVTNERTSMWTFKVEQMMSLRMNQYFIHKAAIKM